MIPRTRPFHETVVPRARPLRCAVFIYAALTACSDSSGPATSTDPVAHIDAVSGDGQKAPPGAPVAEPLRARVTDASYNPLEGIPVVFSVTLGGGQIAADTAISDHFGMVTSGPWTLGAGGLQEVRAHAGQMQTVFKATLDIPHDVPEGEASPHCQSLTFVREGTILLTPCEGSQTIALATEATRPAWSPHGSMIAFARPTNDRLAKWQLCVAREDGSDARCVVGDRNGFVVGRPSWSPDGSRVAFSVGCPECSGKEVYSSLYVLHIASMLVEPIDTPPLTSVSWSPDGSKIAFTAFGLGAYGRGALGTVNPDGSGLRIVAPSLGTYSAWEVAWSPDGQELALGLWDESVCPWLCDTAIGVANADATGLRILATGRTSEGAWLWAPAWSPEGDRIAYTDSRGDFCAGYDSIDCGSDVRVVDVDGGSSDVLLASAGVASWRP